MKVKVIEKTLEAGVSMHPEDLVGAFKEAGFRFDSETCPVQFSRPFDVTRNPDGSTTFRQTQYLKEDVHASGQ